MGFKKLLFGLGLTALLVVASPPLFQRLGWIDVVSDRAWLILAVVGGGLIAKLLIADVANDGDFLFHKYGYDNCIVTFGASLTAVALQLMTEVDLFPGFSSGPLRIVSVVVDGPLNARKAQLFLVFFAALLASLLTARVSRGIKRGETEARRGLALLNAVIGLTMLGVYMLLLLGKE